MVATHKVASLKATICRDAFHNAATQKAATNKTAKAQVPNHGWFSSLALVLLSLGP